MRTSRSEDSPNVHPSRGGNDAADALLLEMYGAAARADGNHPDGRYCFVTLNVRDFSVVGDDLRLPHPDCAEFFTGPRSPYFISCRQR